MLEDRQKRRIARARARRTRRGTRTRRFVLAGLVAGLLLVGAVVFLVNTANQTASNPIVIAVASGFGAQDPNLEAGRAVQHGVDLYVRALNQSGGVAGHPVKLVYYDDRSDPQEAMRQARLISNSRALVVLGHLQSVNSVAAGPIYQAAGLPAITGSSFSDAVTQGNPYYFKTVSTNSAQGQMAAIYMQQVLKANTATIIYSDDTFGKTVLGGFTATFHGTLKHSLVFETDDNKRQQSLQAIVDQMTTDPDSGMVMLAMVDIYAKDFVIALRQRHVPAALFSNATVGTDAFNDFFQGLAEGKNQPGFFTQGMYALAPIILDSGSSTAQDFASLYRATYGVPARWEAVEYYNAILVAAAAIGRAAVQNTSQSVQADRQRIRDQLAAMTSPQTGVPGLDGPIFFDAQRNRPAPYRVGYFQQGKLISAPVQIQAIPNLALVDINQETQAGDVIQIDGRYDWLQRVVYAGIDPLAITAVNLNNSTFTADFYLWLRYNGSDDATHITFPDAPDLTLDPATQVDSQTIAGLNYQLYELRGDFRANYDLHDYPFDRQHLVIRFQNSNLPSDRLVYAVDVFGLRLPRSTAETAKPFQSLQTWTLQNTIYAVNNFSSSSSRGDPRVFTVASNVDYPGISVDFNVRRNYATFLLKNLLPLALLVLVLFAALFFPLEMFSERISTAVTALLSAAVLLIALDQQLPDIGYYVALEFIYYIFFGLCLFCMLIAMRMNQLLTAKQEKQALHWEIGGRVVYVLVVVGVTFYFWFRFG